MDWVADRYAYLEVCLARALARCGDPGGYTVLFGYLNDMRSFLSGSALAELRELSGCDFRFDCGGWSEWLEENAASIECKPLNRRFD